MLGAYSMTLSLALFALAGACLCSSGSHVCTSGGHGECNRTTGLCTCIARGWYGDLCQRSGRAQALAAGFTLGPLLFAVVIVSVWKVHRSLHDHYDTFCEQQAAIGADESPKVNIANGLAGMSQSFS